MQAPPNTSQLTSSPTHQSARLKDVTPKLNKLFTNKLMGIIDDRFSTKNMSKSKQQWNRKFNIPQDSKIYHYTCRQTYRIGNTLRTQFSQPHEKQLSNIENKQLRGYMGIGGFTMLYGLGSLFTRLGPKWGKLTAGNRINYLIVYSLLLQAINYVEIDHILGVFDVVLKYNKLYEQAITKFENN